MYLINKKQRTITGGIFYCRELGKLKVHRSLQTSSWLDSDVLRNRQLTIPPKRYRSCYWDGGGTIKQTGCQ